MINNSKFLKIKNFISKEAKINKVPIIKQDVGKILIFLVKLKKPKKILELGTGFGMSTLHLLQSCDNNTKIDTIDASINSYKFTKSWIDKNKIKNVKLYNIRALEFLKNTKKKYDLFFIDAVKKEYIDYLNYCLNLAKKNSFLIFDNIYFRLNKKKKNKKIELKKFRDYLKHKDDIIYFFIDIADGLAIVIKK